MAVDMCVVSLWDCLCAGLETRLQLYEPLVTLQKQVAGLLGHADRASQVLLCLATAARKSGRLPVAMTALHELQVTLRYACAALCMSALKAATRSH